MNPRQLLFPACLVPCLSTPLGAQTVVNGGFSSTTLRQSLGFGVSVSTAHLDAGWVGSTQNTRIFNTVTATTDPFGTAVGNFRSVGGAGGGGYLVADDGADTVTGTVWNLFSGGVNGTTGFSVDVVVKSAAAVPLTNAAAVQYAVYGFRGDLTALQTALPSLPVTSTGILDDVEGRPGFTTLAIGNLPAASALDTFETRSIPFAPETQGHYDYYLIGFSAPTAGAEGAGIDNVALNVFVLPPAAPTGFSALPISARSIQVSFTDASANEDDFEVQRRPINGGDWVSTIFAANSTGGTVSGLEPETAYEFRVRARNSGGVSDWTPLASATTPALPPPPAVPTGLGSPTTNWFSSEISFQDASADESGFVIAYRPLSGGNWTEIVVDPAAGTGSWVSVIIDQLRAGTAYEFRVRAVNDGGSSPWTDPVARTTSTPPSRPNIIFILADDLGPDGLGSFGSELFAAVTPRIDALATQGIKYPRTFCSGICSPSREQFITGQYPFRNGCLDIDGSSYRSDPQKPSLIKILNAAGYTTAGSGKDCRDSDFAEYLTAPTGGYWNVSAAQISKKGPSPVVPGNYPYHPDALHAFALDFLERNYPRPANGNRPFYLQYSLVNPHTPILATPDTAPGTTDLKIFYRDNIAYIDKVVGEIHDKLIELGIENETLLIFTGDNGSLGTYQSRVWDPKAQAFRALHGGKADRLQYREGSALVPMVVYWPEAVLTPRTENALVDFTDFLPTYAELAQGTVPAQWVTDGHSFAGNILKNPDWQPRTWIFSQLENIWYVRGDRYRLNRDGRLFDMADAPFGMTEVPVATAPEAAVQARAQYQAILDAFDPVNGITYEAHQDSEWSNPAWAWKVANFNSAERWETPMSGDRSDPDRDGVPNIFERAFGWNPRNGTDAMPQIAFDGSNLAVTVPQTLFNDTAVSAESSSTLQSWQAVAPGGNTFSLPVSPGPPGTFLRLRAGRVTPWNEP